MNLGPPSRLRCTEVHSLNSPVSNLTSHYFSPCASTIAPLIHFWLPSGLQAFGRKGPTLPSTWQSPLISTTIAQNTPEHSNCIQSNITYKCLWCISINIMDEHDFWIYTRGYGNIQPICHIRVNFEISTPKMEHKLYLPTLNFCTLINTCIYIYIICI